MEKVFAGKSEEYIRESLKRFETRREQLFYCMALIDAIMILKEGRECGKPQRELEDFLQSISNSIREAKI